MNEGKTRMGVALVLEQRCFCVNNSDFDSVCISLKAHSAVSECASFLAKHFLGGQIMGNSKIILSVLILLATVAGYSTVALCDWNPEDGHKMHFPQEPNPDGWDVCLCCQWIADDFTCSRTGPIDDMLLY